MPRALRSLPAACHCGKECNLQSTPPLMAAGLHRRVAGGTTGAVLVTARRAKERTYPELCGSSCCRLTAVVLEIGGAPPARKVCQLNALSAVHQQCNSKTACASWVRHVPIKNGPGTEGKLVSFQFRLLGRRRCKVPTAQPSRCALANSGSHSRRATWPDHHQPQAELLPQGTHLAGDDSTLLWRQVQ